MKKDKVIMKNIILNNDIEKTYNPKNGLTLLSMILNGGNIGGYIKDIINIYQESMNQEVLNSLEHRISKLEKSLYKNLRDSISSEDGLSLIHYAFVKTMFCHKKEQIEKFTDIIIAALAEKRLSNTDAEMLIDIVSNLNMVEAVYFKELFCRLRDHYKEYDAARYEMNFWELDKKFVRKFEEISILERLIAKGLLDKKVEKEDFTWGGLDKLNNYNVKYKYTYYGQLFINIVYDWPNINHNSSDTK